MYEELGVDRTAILRLVALTFAVFRFIDALITVVRNTVLVVVRIWTTVSILKAVRIFWLVDTFIFFIDNTVLVRILSVGAAIEIVDTVFAFETAADAWRLLDFYFDGIGSAPPTQLTYRVALFIGVSQGPSRY